MENKKESNKKNSNDKKRLRFAKGEAKDPIWIGKK
jgi:hypothetical protein